MPRLKLAWGHAPPLQALLFWQSCLLCALLGLLALQWPDCALLSLALLLWADSRLHPWRFTSAPQLAPLNLVRLGLALIFFAGAWQAGSLLLPPLPPPLPLWMERSAPAPAPRLHGRVDKVQGLTDNRLRIILDQVDVDLPPDPTQNPQKKARLPVEGKVAWTWDKPARRPLEGERWALSAPISPAQGFQNRGTSDWGFTARSQGIFWRVWIKGERGLPCREAPHRSPAPEAASVAALETASRPAPVTASVADLETASVAAFGIKPALWRESLRQKFFAALRPAAKNKAPCGPQEALVPLTQAQAILPALLFGDRSALSDHTVQLFTRGTLVHSLALSGQHLAVSALLAALLLLILSRAWSGAFLLAPRSKLLILCSLPLAALYLWLGNAPPSLQRAACMMLLLGLCLWRNTAMTSLDILCAAVACLMLLAPLSIFDLGLQLSVLCVGSIALVVPLLRCLPRLHKESPQGPWWRYGFAALRGMAGIVLVSCTVQVALLPVSLLAFGTVSPWFVLNVLWLPVLGVIVLPLGALALLLVALNLPTLAHALLLLAQGPCEILLWGLQSLYAHGWLPDSAFVRPHWTALPAFAALAVATALLWGRQRVPAASRRLALAGALLLLMGPGLRYAERWQPQLTLHMLDVGQGQALALDIPGGKRILIDGGGSFSPRFEVGRALVSPALTYNASPRLEMVINSHPHADHLKGLLYILKEFRVHAWYHNGQPPHASLGQGLHAALDAQPALRKTEHSALRAGDRLVLCTQPRLLLEVLHPPRNLRVEKQNDRSLVLRLVEERREEQESEKIHRRGLALFMGDLEAEGLDILLASGQDMQAEVLVIPHHGSRGSYSPALYQAVRPQKALISYGRHNRYGCPAPEILEALEEQQVPCYESARDGHVRLRWKGPELRLQAKPL